MQIFTKILLLAQFGFVLVVSNWNFKICIASHVDSK